MEGYRGSTRRGSESPLARRGVGLARGQSRRTELGAVGRVGEQLRLEGDAVTLPQQPVGPRSLAAVEEVAGVHLQAGLVGVQFEAGAGVRRREHGRRTVPVRSEDDVVVDASSGLDLLVWRTDGPPDDARAPEVEGGPGDLRDVARGYAGRIDRRVAIRRQLEEMAVDTARIVAVEVEIRVAGHVHDGRLVGRGFELDADRIGRDGEPGPRLQGSREPLVAVGTHEAEYQLVGRVRLDRPRP